MTARYGDRDVSDDTALIVDRLDDLDTRLAEIAAVLREIAKALNPTATSTDALIAARFEDDATAGQEDPVA